MKVTEIFRELFPVRVEDKNKEQSTWEYKQFREYLLSLSSGPENIISINDYPQTIRLSRYWHGILDKLRWESQDGLERLSFIGGADNRLLVQEDFIIGEPHHIPPNLVSEAIRQGTDRTRTKFIGTIHSHPRRRLELDILGGLFKGRIHHVAGFSPGDLYSFIVPFSSYRLYHGYLEMYLQMVVEGNGVALVMRTKETKSTEINNPELVSREWFKNYWKQQKRDNIHLSPDLEIAKRHNLVFYCGNVGKDLNRIYP